MFCLDFIFFIANRWVFNKISFLRCKNNKFVNNAILDMSMENNVRNVRFCIFG